MRYQWSPLFIVLTAAMTLPAGAQQQSIAWQNDLEAAKRTAKDSGRLVLVHFWTPSCAPCVALDQNVFNQPGVSTTIETRYVPVKVNADEYPAIAQWYGIDRVPTDVVITPDGQLVGKLISPPTPMAYVAEVSALASKHAAKSGGAFASAAAAAPVLPQINAAYAGLSVGPNTPLAISPSGGAQDNNRNALAGFGVGASTGSASIPPAANALAPNTAPPVAPQLITNPAAANPAASQTQPPVTPAGQPLFPTPPVQVTNPYLAGATTPPAQLHPATQFSPPYPAAAPPLATSATGPSAPAVPAGPPDPSKLPPGSPPLGFDGYCPVSMRNTWDWVPGDPRWGIIHLGRTYWFAGPEEQKQFWADPVRYAPALSGMDPVLAVDHKQNVPGKREHSLDFDGLFYMFVSEATLQQFSANPQRYAASVRQAMGIPRGRLVR
jgi:protein disulfide-isomerase